MLKMIRVVLVAVVGLLVSAGPATAWQRANAHTFTNAISAARALVEAKIRQQRTPNTYNPTPTMPKLALLALLALTPIQDDTYLYKVTLIRAAPGHLLDVVDAYRDRVPVYDAAGEQRPVMIRHSQGDHWDLMVIEPVQSLPAYYDSDGVARRVSAGEAAGVSPHEFDARLQQIISWKEETFFSGVPVQEFRRRFDAANYFHVELFVALPGKGQELYEERVMENEYLRRIGRPQNLIFAKALGGSWDSFTLGFYRDIKHFAESADTPADLQQEAAVAAGFEGADKIGTYLRELISRHNDTLAGKVPLW